MDPVQARALDTLEPFIALSKSATSPRAAADLVTRATSAANTYVFAELLETPNIQSLRQAGDDHARFLTLLEVFAWGTWQDYTSTPGLPTLNYAQTQKLRLLSLLPLSTATRPLTYASLQSALSLSTARALEGLVISATYAGLLTAKLSPSTQLIHVSSVSPLRDLAPNSVPRLTATLDEWDGRCTAVLADLEAQVAEVKRRAGERRRREGEVRAATEKAMLSSGDKGTGKRAAADGGVDLGEGMDPSDEHMDVDEGEVAGVRNGVSGGSQRKNARTRFGGAMRRLG